MQFLPLEVQHIIPAAPLTIEKCLDSKQQDNIKYHCATD